MDSADTIVMESPLVSFDGAGGGSAAGPVVLDGGCWRAEAAGAEWAAGASRWVLSEAWVRPCVGGGGEPWSVTARRVVWTPGRSLRLERAWVRVLGAPVVPLPAMSLPLARRSGLLMPVVGAEGGAYSAEWPLFVTLGAAQDLTISPTARTDRGVGLRVGHRAVTRRGEGGIDGWSGWDRVDDRLRGQVAWDQRWSLGRSGLASRGEWLSDAEVVADFGVDRLARRSPWHASQARLWAGPFEAVVGATGVESGRPRAQGAVGVASSVVAPRLGVAASGRLAALGDTLGGGPSVVGGGEVYRPLGDGALRWTPFAEATGTWGVDDMPSGRVTAGSELALRAWRVAGGGLERAELGVRGGGDLAANGDLGAWAAPYASWSGASSRAAWGARLSGDTRGDLRGVGWWEASRGAGWLSAGVNAHTGAVSLVGRAQIDGAWARGSLGVAASDVDLTQGGGSVDLRLPGPLSTVWIGGGGWGDPLARAWLEREVRAAWDHPSGCLGASVRAAWTDDRQGVAVSVALRATPGLRPPTP